MEEVVWDQGEEGKAAQGSVPCRAGEFGFRAE